MRGDGRVTIQMVMKIRQIETLFGFGLTEERFFLILNVMLLCDIQIHEDKMTDTSAHNKQMKDFMRTEIFMS